MTKERRLGRGLEALLSRADTSQQSTHTETQVSGSTPDEAFQAEGITQSAYNPQPPVTPENHSPEYDQNHQEVEDADPSQVPVDQIDSNPFQPREDFDDDEIASLAESLESHGLLQPVVVRRIEDRFQLIAGERRLRAATKAGWTEVPIRIIEADNRQVAELAIIENLQRKDLGPLEKAASFQRYLKQYGGTQEDLAKRLKLDRSTIANLIRLLELPEAVQDAVRRGKITQGHARALLPLGDEREQIAVSERIQAEGLSVRKTEALIQEMIRDADAESLKVIGFEEANQPRRPTNEHLAALEQQFRSALGTRVKLSHNVRGRGKLVIHFSSHEEFDRIREDILGPDIQSDVG